MAAKYYRTINYVSHKCKCLHCGELSGLKLSTTHKLLIQIKSFVWENCISHIFLSKNFLTFLQQKQNNKMTKSPTLLTFYVYNNSKLIEISMATVTQLLFQHRNEIHVQLNFIECRWSPTKKIVIDQNWLSIEAINNAAMNTRDDDDADADAADDNDGDDGEEVPELDTVVIFTFMPWSQWPIVPHAK